MPESRVDLLLEPFRVPYTATLVAMVGQGYKPVTHETRRSKERALALVVAGKSKARGGLSMHCYDIAADTICGVHGYMCHRHRCRFFHDLGANGEDNGLIWGGNWDRDAVSGEPGEHDKPHLQAVPVGRWQELVRAASNPDRVAEIVRAFRRGRPWREVAG